MAAKRSKPIPFLWTWTYHLYEDGWHAAPTPVAAKEHSVVSPPLHESDAQQALCTMDPPSSVLPENRVQKRDEHGLLMDTREAAKFLNLPFETVRSWGSQRRLPTVRIGDGRRPMLRFSRADLELWVKKQKQAEAPGLTLIQDRQYPSRREGRRRPRRKEG